SCRTTVTVAVCTAGSSAAGVNDSVPLESMLGCDENSALLSFDVRNVSVWPDSLGGPAERLVAQPVNTWGPSFSNADSSGPRVKLGGWLTGCSVMVNVWGALVSLPLLAVPPLSFSTRVIVALPNWLVAGVK